MSQPTDYTPTTDFSQQEAINASGRSTVNTAALDLEFANIETTLDQTLSNLALLQRDDGRLKDVIVDVYTLAPDVLNLMGGFNLRGLWAIATDYALNDICSNGAYTYLCKAAHTSGGAFDASKWIQFGFTSGSDAAQAAAAAQVSASAAAGSASTASTAATNASNSATSATNSATSASASASTATTKAADASASATSAANSASAAAVSASSIDTSLFVQKSGSTMTGALILASGSTAPNPATGTRSQALATMQKFADEFGASLSASGYQKLPSGLIVQWGNFTSSASGAQSFTFPISFPNSTAPRCSILPFVQSAQMATMESISASGGAFSVWNTSGARVATGVQMIAIGY